MLSAFTADGADAAARFWSPDITWRAVEGAPDDVGEMRGPDRVRRYLADWSESFGDITVEPTHVLDLGGGRVIATLKLCARGRTSGVEATLEFAALYEVRNHLIASVREYASAERAIAAATSADSD